MNSVREVFTKQWMAANMPWILLVMTFAFFSRKALFNLPILIMTVGGIWLLLRRFSGISSMRVFRYMIVFFLCLWLPMMLALPDAVSSRAYLTAARFIAFPLAAAFIFFHLTQSLHLQRRVFYGVCAVIVFLCIDAFFQFIVGYNFLGFPYNGSIVNGMSSPHTGLGLVLATMSPLLLELVRRHAVKYKLLWLVLPLVVSVVFLSTSRTAWFMLMTGAFFFGIYMLRFYQWEIIAKISVIALILLSVMGYAAYNTAKFKPRIDNTLLLFKGDYKSLDRATSHRLSLWITAWNIGSKNLVNGIGVRGFRKVYAQYAAKDDMWVKLPGFAITGIAQTHPHQTGLEVFAETGLIGVIGFLLFWVTIFRVLRRIKPEASADVIPWFIVLMVAVNPMNVHMAFYGSIWSTIVMMTMITGLAFASGNFKDDTK